MKNLPKITFTKDNYPTAEYLEWVASYRPDEINTSEFLDILKDNWVYNDWGFVFKKARNGVRTLELHTGGWSGNEEVIYVLRANAFFFPMFWKETHVGGHYYFSIKTEFLNKKAFKKTLKKEEL